MIRSESNILIIGSTGRNVGKTEFACRIIEKYATLYKITGIKVIPVDKDEDGCHKGDESCGLCNSLTGRYEIIEEKTTGLSKDTSRMLRAGAKKVYLLLVDRNSLETGIHAVLSTILDGDLVVVESNSIRNVVKPGLFIVIRGSKRNSVKQSCAEVIDFADKVITYNNKSWDLLPENVLVENGSWKINE